MKIDLNALPLGEIQYVPRHRCPTCGAPGEPYEPISRQLPDTPEWIGVWRYYGADMSPIAKEWEERIGYVLFDCHCRHHSGRALRVVHIGDAILPVDFIDDWNSPLKPYTDHMEYGDIAVLNRRHVARAVNHLAENADPARLAGTNMLRRILFAVATGDEQPDHAYDRILKWFDRGEAERYFAVAANAAIATA